jgi:hypothetical protein
MDTKEYIFDRHMTKWEDYNKRVKRTAVGALIFCIILLFRILLPFSNIETQKKPIMELIHKIELKKNQLNSEKEILQRFSPSMKRIRKTIDIKPWNHEKQKLIQFFRKRNDRIRTGESVRELDPQAAADETIQNVVDTITNEVVAPLKKIINEAPPDSAQRPTNVSRSKPFLAEVSGAVETLEKKIAAWHDRHFGSNWYSTINEKTLAMGSLAFSVEREIDRFSNTLRLMQQKAEVQVKDLESEFSEVKNRLREETEHLESLEQEFQKILPEWLQGFLSLPDMLQLLPLLILVFCFVVSVWAVMLTNHYEYIASGVGLSSEERQDLAASTIWTLTFKGRLGSALTSLVYILFILSMWFFYERGFAILIKWGAGNPDHFWFDNLFPSNAIRWIGRVIFVALITFFLKEPNRRKARLQKLS